MYTDPTHAMVNALVVRNATVLHYINARHSICQSNDLQLCTASALMRRLVAVELVSMAP